MPDNNELESTTWNDLNSHCDRIRPLHLRDLFSQDPNRFGSFSLGLPGLLLDYSRQRINRETVDLLTRLAEERDLPSWIERLFSGAQVNSTEHRPALHTLLRQQPGASLPDPLVDRFDTVLAMRDRMESFANAVRDGEWTGVGGKRITDVVNIGIGGSHLGPQMVCEALAPRGGAQPRAHFLANVDPALAAGLLDELDPATTLVIVVSKTFTTQETLANAATVRQWWLDKTGQPDGLARHFAAVTASPGKAAEFGIPGDNIFEFWDWVGGRYSMWSAVGLAIAISLGPDVFDQLLEGAHRMDRHFAEAPFAENMPVMLGLLDVWNTDFFGSASRAVVPYRDSLRYLPAYLQQLEMESNGKRVRRDGSPVPYETQPVVWGNVGTNGQHAFFQLLHQGTQVVPVDFIVALADDVGNRRQQDMLVANCLAQAEALARGRTEAETRDMIDTRGGNGELVPHQTFPGNRPSSLLVLDRFDARTLGMLVALYEHKVFVSSCIWGINPFDQMGVELGKTLASRILEGIDDLDVIDDPATAALLERYRRTRTSVP
ncbi:MAG TPA: glucose-6-phosphate isomerase [Gammaproteobacteria bacterium]|nr:glucose-6-phosphate isomerase [Gammaproteobacteria bacterium]